MQPIPVAFDPPDAEYWPLDKLVTLQERRLCAGTLERAGRSSLYADHLPRALKLGGRDELRALPFTTADHLRAVMRGRGLRRLATEAPYLWLCSASAADRKWTPQAPEDLQRTMGILGRVIRMLRLVPSEVLLVISQPAPLLQNSLPYLLMYADRWDTRRNLELIVGTMAMAEPNNWPEFAVRRQASMLIARPSDALALSPRFARAGGEGFTLPRQAFQRLRRGLFYGECLEPYRVRLQDEFGLEAFACYASLEYPYYACECPAHAGLHVWIDLSIPEIIPDQQVARACSDRHYRPMSFFLDQAPAGLEGELVVTTFAHSLPMVRYRTGDRVRVVSTEPCACGCTHPRIEILNRLETP
ncbi:MAG: phenylacetate--CoA ligase family protein [Anaerolineae bacterium]